MLGRQGIGMSGEVSCDAVVRAIAPAMRRFYGRLYGGTCMRMEPTVVRSLRRCGKLSQAIAEHEYECQRALDDMDRVEAAAAEDGDVGAAEVQAAWKCGCKR